MTRFMPKAIAIAVLALTAAGAALADVNTNVPAGATTGLPFVSFGNSPNPSGDSPQVGQVFSLTTDFLLSSFSFYALGNQSLSLQLNVAEWNPGSNVLNQVGNSVGASLLTSTNLASSYNAAGGYTTLQFDNLGLNLDGGTKYIAYLSSSNPGVTGVQLSRTQTANDATGFGLGHAYLSTIPGQGWQLPFNGNGFLSLQYTAVTTPVPEPETYGMLLAGLAAVGAMSRRRRPPSANQTA